MSNALPESPFLSKLLELIADSSDGPQSLRTLCLAAGGSDAFADAITETVIPFLKVFDAIETTYIGGDLHIKARAKTARLFLKSVAAFIKESKCAVSDWERRSIAAPGSDTYSVSQITNGPQFLRILEEIRISDARPSQPLRHSNVVKALIKIKRGKGDHGQAFLVQHDNDTPQYQLIGGHVLPTDPDLETAMKREIAEELNQQSLRFSVDYDLKALGSPIELAQLSAAYGAYTSYKLSYFLVMLKRELVLGPKDRWVSLEELLTGRAKDGQGINEKAIVELDKKLVGGLRALPLSWHVPDKSPYSQAFNGNSVKEILNNQWVVTIGTGLVVAALVWLFGWGS